MANINTISPFNFGTYSVRVILRNNEPWFVATDICTALGYKNTSKAIADHLDDDERSNEQLDRTQMGSKAVIINESGLYALVLRSRKPEARKFAKWVTSEVLPAIRKTGEYKVKAKPTTKALPNCLTVEQQKAIQAIVKTRVDLLPEDKRAKGAITLWSALKSKFGASYKEIPESEFSDALSLVARVDLNWELVDVRKKEFQRLNWTRIRPDEQNLTANLGHSIISDIKNWSYNNLPKEINDDMYEALNTLSRVIVRSTTDMQEAIINFKIGIHYLNRFRN